MAGNDYLIPFGIDPREFNTGIDGMEARMDNLVASSQQANRDMQNGFNQSAAASDNLTQSIGENAEAAADLRDEAAQLGRTLGGALNTPASASELEKRLAKFTELLTRMQQQAGKPLNIAIDTARLDALGAALESGADDLQVLAQLADLVKDQLATMVPTDTGFQELSTQVQTIEAFLQGLNEAGGDTEATFAGVNATFEQVYGELQPLSARLGELEDRLYELALAGEQNSEEYRTLQAEAIRYRQTIQQVDAQVDTFARSSAKLDVVVQAAQGLVGAFTAAQGAVALFGEENEEAQKVIQKVTGAMAVLQGIQSVAAALNKDSALGALLVSRAQAAQVVTTTALAGATTAEAAATAGATAATNGFTAALLANPITAVVVLVTALVAALVAFASSSDDAKKATDDLNSSLETQNRLLSLDEAAINRRTALFAAQAKAAGAAESEITKIQNQGLQSRRNALVTAMNDFIVNEYNNGALRAKADLETNKKIEEQYIDYTERLKDIDNEIAIGRIEQSQQVKEESIAAGKEAEAAAKKASEEAKKRAEEQKQILTQQAKFANELRDQQNAAITDQYEKERAQARAASNDRIAALNSEKALSKQAAEDRAAAIELIEANLATRLIEIDKTEDEERAKLKFEALKIITDLEADSAQKTLDILAEDFQERRNQINEQYKNEEALRVRLIAAINQAEIAETKKAKDKIATEALAKDQERAELEVETAARFVGDIPYIEEQKQIAILEVKLKYAKLAKQQLIDQGNAENSIAVLGAQKDINDVTAQLDKAKKDLDKQTGKGVFNLQKILFGDQGEEGNQKIQEALATTYDSIQQITDFIVDQYQRQIDKRQEVIDSYDDAISDLEDQLDEEKSLREQGFANNVDLLQQEIAEKKKQRDEEFKQQQELQKKQQAAQRAQLVLDTAVQASNLITAATEIFAALAGIPFVGVALAIASIGVMVGAFVAAKVKAFQVVGDGPKYADGGWIDGPAHSRGGVKYRTANGIGPELEGGEFVTNKRQSEKYGDLLEGINRDDISDDVLRDFLADLGISLESDKQQRAVEIVRQREELRTVVFMQPAGESEELAAIKEDVGYLAKRKREEVERWEDGQFYYEKRGNKTTKMRKK